MNYWPGFEINRKSLVLLSILAILPNFLGLINLSLFGIKLHFFQYAIFLAAIVYGPAGGFISGAIGSVYIAMTLNNPYIILGNVILGFSFGVFVRLKWNAVLAGLTAFAIQVPWLWITDVYLMKMPTNLVIGIIIALFLSNIVWSFAADKSKRYFYD